MVALQDGNIENHNKSAWGMLFTFKNISLIVCLIVIVNYYAYMLQFPRDFPYYQHKAKKKLHILMSLSNRLGCESCAAKKAFNLIFSEVGGAKQKLYHISSR